MLTNADIVSPNKTDIVVRMPPVMRAFRRLTLTEKRPQPKTNETLAVIIPGFKILIMNRYAGLLIGS
jgi:hypothetical protein